MTTETIMDEIATSAPAVFNGQHAGNGDGKHTAEVKTIVNGMYAQYADGAATAKRFLSALFGPDEWILLRPIETWNEGGFKRSRTDFEGTRSLRLANRSETLLPVVMQRSERSRTNLFFGVCPRFGQAGYDLQFQIRKAHCLWADIDDTTVEAALETCEESNLPQPSIVVKSGHGAHLYWLLSDPYIIDDVADPPKVEQEWVDLEIKGESKRKPIQYFKDGGDKVYLQDPKSEKKIPSNEPDLSAKAKRFRNILAGLAKTIGADHTIDLSRLLRIPGTMNRKDQRNGAEPVPCELVRCEPERRYSLDEFEHLAEKSDEAKKEKALANIPLPIVRKMNPTREDKLNEKVAACGLDGIDRSRADYHLCLWAIERGYDKADVWQRCQNVGKFEERGEDYFHQTWDKAEGDARAIKLEEIQTGKTKSKKSTPQRAKPTQTVDARKDPTPILGDPPRDDKPTDTACAFEECTDLGNSRRFIHRNGGNVRHCFPFKKWYVWDGRRWRVDDVGDIRRRAQFTARRIMVEADLAEDQQVADWATTSQDSRHVDNIIKEARAEGGVPILPEDLDRHHFLFNCPNGTLDLETGKLRPHRREDLITKLCPTIYDPDASSELWEQTLHTIFNGNEEIIEFTHRWLGYCLTGDVREQKLPNWWGEGSNGKSLILNTILKSMGKDYAGPTPPALLVCTDNERHPTERADLFGKRFMPCLEVDEGAKLAEAVVKRLTGGDAIKARKMREDFWEYEPTFKFIVCANHKIKVTGTDHGIWRRLLFVPFVVQFWDPSKNETGPEHLRQDKTLEKRLPAMAPGILAWMVRGCQKWIKDGLYIPDCILAATADYRADQDIVARFMEDECVKLREAKAKSGKLFERLESWLKQNGEDHVISNKVMSERLQAMGFQIKTSNGCRWFYGIGLRDRSREADDDDSRGWGGPDY